MRIAIANDHNGVELKQKLTEYLTNKGYDVINYGTDTKDRVDYPKYGIIVGEKVANKEADFGIVICGSAIGISIACNKVKGIRCAKIDNKDEAKSAKEHNNANILAFSSQSHTAIEIKEMIDVFVNSTFNLDERYIMRIRQVENYEETNEY